MTNPLQSRSRMRRIVDGILSAAAAVALWQAVVTLAGTPRFILPGPLDVFHALIGNAALIADNAAATIGEVLGGLFLGSFVGIVTAILLMMSPLAQRLVMPAMVFSQAIPIFALAPILTLWLGYGPASKIAVTVLMIFFPVVSTFFDGMMRTERSLIDAAEILGAGRMAILFRIRIPAAFPALASGLSFREPMQGSQLKQMGVLKPYAVTRSYGLMVQCDQQMRPLRSFHSRADGAMHGCVAACERGDDLFVASKGNGRVLRLSGVAREG